MVISDEDRQWLIKTFLGLNIGSSENGYIITGCLEFSAAFDELGKEYRINPSEEDSLRLICIDDKYEIKIQIFHDENKYPQVWETNKRITRQAQKHGLNIFDLHIYKSGEVCLVGPFDMNSNLAFREFINGPVIQFFYDQSYFERFGRWPRGQYSHGIFGLFENFHDHISTLSDNLVLDCLQHMARQSNWSQFIDYIVLKERVQGHVDCPCGSKKIFRDCHQGAFRGLWNLQKYIKDNPKVIDTFLNSSKKPD